ncbi:MAG: hypothetical protein ACXV7C_12925 [Candidatus Angelobacter sp.]
MSLRTTALLLVFSASTLFAQTQAPAPPQTPRQALIEIITGGEQGAMKHLTVEMQKSLEGNGKNKPSQELAVFDQIKAASSEFQVFESGQVLLAANDSKSHEKFEVHVDSDDLSGDTDNIDISFHQFRDGIETEVPYAALLSRFTIGLKQQQNVWRLNELSVNIKVPLGDPKLLEKFGNGVPGMYGAKVGGGSSSKAEKPRDMTPKEAITMVAFAESSFATRHPEVGFTCSLADLAEPNPFNLDTRIFSGEPYQGYKFALSGCQGKPSGSFHLIAEPVSPAAGVKAYCTDATHNVRASEDGRGSSCLAFGKVDRALQHGGDGMTAVGVDVHVHPDKPKP